MSIGRPSFYLASLLEDTQTRLLYDRLVLERDHPERKLLIPKFRRKKKCARHPSSVIEAFISVGATTIRQMPQTDSQAAQTDSKAAQSDLQGPQNDLQGSRGDLKNAQNSLRRSSHDEDS
jgi:hypothetical protein